MLASEGTLILKYWLHISQEEQFRRFKEREETGHKRYKLTDEDWRNREKWPQYEEAICDMMERTSTRTAPWHLVSSEDKYHGRIEVLRNVCDTIEAAL
tara:strand:+ start:1044 stop:1337 length:294 start_codon:yes stop_codon:yes gene_type:complete